MSQSTTHPTICVKSLKLLSDYWTLRIIDALQTEPLRFCALQRVLDQVNPVTLTQRLKKLEQEGLLERLEEGTSTNAVTYRLTTKGLSTLPILAAVATFASGNTK
jgi:DNA-binding HxlR family transcriptional regulator